MKTTIDISGSWLGTYWQGRRPTRFEAHLVQGGSVIDGRILDDGYLGEASLQGELLGSRIFFIKRYLVTSPSPIRYSGTLSTDGSYMYGDWRIGHFDSGSWEAHRTEDTLSTEFAKLATARSRAIAPFSTENFSFT